MPVDLAPGYDVAPVAAACAAAAPHTGWLRTAGATASSPPKLVANGEFQHNKPARAPKRKARAQREVDE